MARASLVALEDADDGDPLSPAGPGSMSPQSRTRHRQLAALDARHYPSTNSQADPPHQQQRRSTLAEVNKLANRVAAIHAGRNV